MKDSFHKRLCLLTILVVHWDDWKVQVVTEALPFPKHLPVKRVSVNSFGYGGTNAHVIIEGTDSFLPCARKYTDSTQGKKKAQRGTFNRNRPFLLPFSAHDKVALKNNIAAFGKVAHKYNLLDLSYTLATRRTVFQSRGFVVVSLTNLDACFSGDGEAFVVADKKKAPTIGFVFTGQGAQWATMGNELMAYYPSFLRSIRMLDRALGDLADGPDWTLEDTLLEYRDTSRVNEAEYSQPLCTAIQVAIVQLLQLWGIRPVVTVGHSSGEIAAAFAAGLISATEAIMVAYYRGKVVRDVITDGAMIAVGLGAEDVEPHLQDVSNRVVIACHNSPSSVTLSGDADAIEAVKKKLDAEKVFARVIKTGGKAYHSHHMKPVAAKYVTLVQQARAMLHFDLPQASDVRMVSSVTNSTVDANTIVDEHYWSANLCSPVLFDQAIQTIATDDRFRGVDLLVEIGPHSALSGPIRQICQAFGFDKPGYLPTLLRESDSAAQLLKLAGELFLRDYPLDMERVTLIEEPLSSGKVSLVKGTFITDLPTYKWNYTKEYWAEPRRSKEHRAPRHARHDILGGRIPGGFMSEPIWRNVLRIRDVPWLAHHSLGGEAVFPAAGYFSMAIEAITQLNDDSSSPVKIDGYVLRGILIKAALVTPENDTGIEVICSMKPSVFHQANSEHVWWDFNISSVSETGQGTDHMAGSIAINARQRQAPRMVPRFTQRASGKAWNHALREVGFDYGPTFQDMHDICFDGKSYSAACKTRIRSACGIMEGESRHVLHPGTVDSCLQLIIVSIYAGRMNDMTCGAVPIQVDEVAIWVPTEEQFQNSSADVFSWADERGLRSFVTGSQLVASNGDLLMDISNMRCTTYEAALPQKVDESLASQPYGEMVWKYDIDSLQSSSDLGDMDFYHLFELAVHKNPALEVIEIGSKHATAILSKWELLHYTSIETSDQAAEETGSILQRWKNAQVQRLDISQDLDGATITEGSFDLVIMPPEYLSSTMLANARYLLKQRGHAIFKMSEELSANTLHNVGFKAIMQIRNAGKPALVLCTALPSYTNGVVDGAHHGVQLIFRKRPITLLEKVKEAFERLGWLVTVTSLEDYQSKVGEHVVMLADFEGPLLATLEEKELGAIQNITSAASKLLWVSCGGLLMGKKPEYAMAVGLARSVASEQNSLDFRVLDFDLENTSTEEVIAIITNTTQQQSEKLDSRESEYYVSKGLVYISRLVPNEDANRTYAFDEKEISHKLLDPAVPLVGKVQSGKVVFQAEIFGENLKPDDVEVNVSVAGINKEDTMVISGSDYPTCFSHEIGGVVQRVGEAVNDLKVGDRVFGFSFSNFATVQRTSADLISKAEDGELLMELATIPMAYGTALYGLRNLAKLEAQENVLILNGTGSPGFAAIKVTQSMNAIPYVVAKTEAEATMLMQMFGLDKRHILMDSALSIIAQLKASTGGRGADVVFSAGSVKTNVAQECWRHIVPFGRFVDSGRKNVLTRSTLDTVPLHRGASYLSFDVLELYRWKPKVLGDVLRLATSLYRQGLIIPLSPVTVRNLGELDDAIASFSDNFVAGKTLISYEPSGIALNVLKSQPSLRFRTDATYLLVGCLGGLGRSLTSWMMKKGARRFAFLSRSGTDSKQAQLLVRDIETAGVAVQVIKGDVSVMDDVQRAVKSIPREHPIRGVVQAAMVLKVRMLTFKGECRAD